MVRASAVPARSTTRHRLLEAAHALIWANSYAQTSVDEICRKAGVQKGSFYHFFPTKADLSAAALEEHWEEVQPKLEEIFTSNKTAPAQLRALCSAILMEQQEAVADTGTVCGCPYANVAAELSTSNETLRALTTQMSERFSGYFERLLKNAVAEGLLPMCGIRQRAEEMHIYVMGAMFHARITNQLDSLGKPLENALLRISGMNKVENTPKPVKKR